MESKASFILIRREDIESVILPWPCDFPQSDSVVIGRQGWLAVTQYLIIIRLEGLSRTCGMSQCL